MSFTERWEIIMKILNVDMDNTLIYSYKRDIGNDKINVELYNGREISYITARSFELLSKIKDKFLVVPTTTRTKEQYERIFLGIGHIKYALVCNGGVLLVDGKKNEEWYKTSKELVSESVGELLKAIDYLEREKLRTFEVRFIEELFVFTKCDKPEKVVADLRKKLDNSLVEVFNNGVKVYVVPKKLDKGTSVIRFKAYIESMQKSEKIEKIVAAGDSEFDISMVKCADMGLVPKGFMKKFGLENNNETICEMKGEKIFAEEFMEKLLMEVDNIWTKN